MNDPMHGEKDDNLIGQTGARGETGLTGNRGATGQDGAAGQAGEIGLTGNRGATGETGSDGIAGQDGAAGETGNVGAAGLDGAVGETGDRGQTGNRGAAGLDGAVGETGDRGQTGRRGLTGDHGLDGAIGQTGDAGKTGLRGESGSQGKSGSDPRNRLLTMFVLQIIVVAILGWYAVNNAHNIAENARAAQRADAHERIQQQYVDCSDRAQVIQQFNEFLVSIAKVEQDGIDSGDDPAVTPTRKARIKAYTIAQVGVPVCTPPQGK